MKEIGWEEMLKTAQQANGSRFDVSWSFSGLNWRCKYYGWIFIPRMATYSKDILIHEMGGPFFLFSFILFFCVCALGMGVCYHFT